MEALRGRNLSHIGCTLGLTLGLILGLFGAILVLRVSPTLNTALAVFAGVTIGLGLLGYILGGAATRWFWGPRPDSDSSRS
ncbi:MAG TPA: hypothetical protein VIC85_06715 [Ktedonobacterales bacterium]|jgi:vacuolar-type H+-ATPase subunit I/STV1